MTAVMDESSLSELIRHKNHSAFSYLYDNYSPVIYGEIFRIVKNRQVAEDLLHDVFIIFWQKGYQYDPQKGRLFTWMLAIVRRKCIDHFRKNRDRKDKQPGEILTTDSPAHRSLEFSLLFRNVCDLCPKHLELLRLIYVYGYTHSQASVQSKIPIGTVKTIMRKFIVSARLKYTAFVNQF